MLYGFGRCWIGLVRRFVNVDVAEIDEQLEALSSWSSLRSVLRRVVATCLDDDEKDEHSNNRERLTGTRIDYLT